jgi:nitrate/nitrite-specific signal transduction histidine kinase
LSNAVKHGLAKNIVISLRPREEGFELSIEDDGSGITEGAERSGGMGLAIMRYRAESISAQLDIKRKQDTGTVVLCRVRCTENNVSL